MTVQPARGYLGISEVLAQLRPDFADISVSKIRFLETEGLITPARSPSGYRRFCAADVDRLRYILTAQRDQYLPLRVIKERLARLDQDAAASTGPDGQPGQVPAQGPAPVPAQGPAPAPVPAAGGRPGRVNGRGAGSLAGREPGWLAADRDLAGYGRSGDDGLSGGYARSGSHSRPGASQSGADQLLTRRDLLEAAGISEALLTELDTFGLLRRVGRSYGPDALEVARTAVALTPYGVEARHLRAVRAAAERETTMIESLVAPIMRQRAKGAAELAAQTAGELADLVLRLHGALVEGALAEAGLGGTGLAGTSQPAGERPVTRGVEGASA